MEAVSLVFVFHRPNRQIKPIVEAGVCACVCGGGVRKCRDFLVRLQTVAEVCSACDVKSGIFERLHINRRSQNLAGIHVCKATDRINLFFNES